MLVIWIKKARKTYLWKYFWIKQSIINIMCMKIAECVYKNNMFTSVKLV